MVDILVKMKIDGMLYDQKEHKNDLKEGDLVFDTKDNTYGYIDMIHNNKPDHVAVKQGFVAELGIPMSRLRLLVPSVENSSFN